MNADFRNTTTEAYTSEPSPFEFDSTRPPMEIPYRQPGAFTSRSASPHQLAARGFAQTIGLTPGMAVVTVAADLMLHSADVISAGLLIPFSILCGGILGYITYKAQMKFYGDDDETAKIKCWIVALLTAIPSPLPYVLFVPAGVVGWFHNLRRRNDA